MIKPVKDNILVELLPKECISKGIYIPEITNNVAYAKVIDQGKCNKDIDNLEYPFISKIGDFLIIEVEAGLDTTETNKKYKLIKEKDILLILK